jgi:hypothetical protein
METHRPKSAFLASPRDVGCVYGEKRVADIGARTMFVDADPHFDIGCRNALGGV